MNRTNEAPPNTQIESYPGARLDHIKKLVENYPGKKSKPTTVILSVGINNRLNKNTEIIDQSTALIEAVKAKFPKAEIAFGELNYSKHLPTQ